MKNWLLRITGLLIFAALLWAFCYLKDLSPLGAINAHLGIDTMPSLAISFKNVTLVGWAGGKPVCRLESKQVDVDKDRIRAVFSRGIKGEMFKDGRRIGKIKADKIIYNIYSNDLFVPAAAEFKIDNGPAVKARRVYWNARSSHLACAGGVDAALDIGDVHGSNLSLNLPNREITMSKVNGIIKMGE